MKKMIEEIGESINVLATFSNGKVTPLAFTWRQQKYDRLNMASFWSDYDGDARRIFFTVETDQANLCEICFHTKTLQWTLVRIYHD